MKKNLLFTLILLIFSMSSYAQNFPGVLDVNNVKAGINPKGNQFWMGGNTDNLFEFPKNSGKSPIFNHHIIVGGSDVNGNPMIVGEAYGRDFQTGPLSIDGNATISNSIVSQWNKVWTITKNEVEYHKLHYNDVNYVIPNDILTWPAHGDYVNSDFNLAPFVDINSNQMYEPLLGDYPKIKGDKCIFFIFNDRKSNANNTSFGLEFHVMAYAYNTPNNEAFNNSIFYSYKILNRSSNDIYDSYISFFTDFDLGNSIDDRVETDVKRSAAFVYNSTNSDDIYGANPPVQSFVFLKGAKESNDGVDNNYDCHYYSYNGCNYGDGIIDNEHMGLCKQNFYFSNINILDPLSNNLELNTLNTLKNRKPDGIDITFGGNGYTNTTNIACGYMFPGTSDSCNIGTFYNVPNFTWIDNNSNVDRRGYSSSGPFQFLHNSSMTIDIALVAGYYGNSINENRLNGQN